MKSMKRVWSVALVCLGLGVWSSEAAAQELKPSEGCAYRNTVGFTAGVTTGLGLTYRGSCDAWFAQLAFMPAWTRDNGGNIFAGAQVGRRVQGGDAFYLNVALGTGLMLTEGDVCGVPDDVTDPSKAMWTCQRQRDVYLAGGPSIGLGKVWGEHFQTEIYMPIAVVWEFGEGLHSIVPYPGVTFGYIW